MAEDACGGDGGGGGDGGPGIIPLPLFTGFGGIIPVTGGASRVIAAGEAHSCAVTAEGNVQCWGNNDFGQLGDGSFNGSNVPVDVEGLEGIVGIVAGGWHTCALDANGAMYCWGQNTSGQVGNGTVVDSNKPVKIFGSGVIDLITGFDFSCAVLSTGRVMCWGNNAQGQLNDGTTTNRNSPVIATLINGVSDITAGKITICGLTPEGGIRCWANGETFDVEGLENIATFVTQDRFKINHATILNEEGGVLEWIITNLNMINGVADATESEGGVSHACALTDTGQIYCWGSNSYGELGDGTNKNSAVAVLFLGEEGMTYFAYAAGKHHSCAMNDFGGVVCWGLNNNGQLGNGNFDNSNVPDKVVGW